MYLGLSSFLIDEDDILTEEGREEAGEDYAALPPPAAAGAPAAERAEKEGELEAVDSVGGGEALPEEAAQVVRLVGSKTFLLQDGVWIDTTFDPSRMVTTKVGFGSDEYFDLLAARPEWGMYFALGERVIFLGEGTAYEVVEGGSGPVEIPPTHAPEPGKPTPEPAEKPAPTVPAPENPVPERGQDQPAGVPVMAGEAITTVMSLASWICVAVTVMAAAFVLIVWVLWRRGRR